MAPYLRYYEKNNFCFLPPSGFLRKRKFINNESKWYIQDFIDYLFQKRISDNLFNISFEDINVILDEFLEYTKDNQEKRRLERANYMNEMKELYLRRQFKNGCVVDRKAFLSAVSRIINSYEDNNLSAKLLFTDDWYHSSQRSTLYLYQDLVIQRGDSSYKFRTLVDSDDTYPDEEDCAYVSKEKDGGVKFFDFKEIFYDVYRDSKFF